MTRVSRLSVALLLLGPLLYAGVLGWLLRGALDGFDRRPWERFDVVLTDERDQELVARRLSGAGLEPLWEANALVRIEDFSGGVWIEPAAIEQRLDPADPRRDPFLEAVPGLFRLPDRPEMRAIYVPRRGSLLESWLELRRLLTGVPFQLAGWQPILPLVTAGAFLLALLPLFVRVRRRRLAGLLGAVLLAAYVFTAGPASLVPSFLLALGFWYWLMHSRALERELLVHRRVSDVERGHVAAFVLLVAGTALFFGLASNRLRAALVILALGGLLVSVVTLHLRRIRRSEHRLFTPRSILRAPPRFPGLVPALVLMGLAAAGLPLLETGFMGQQGYALPVPVEREEARTAGAVLRALEPEDALAAPLSTAGFVAHRWFHAALIYGGIYEVPAAGEAISLQRLRRQDGRLESFQEEVIRFDRSWLEAMYRDSGQGVYRLFVEEPGAFAVGYRAVGAAGIDRHLHLQRLALLAVPLGPLMLGMRLPYRGVLGTVGAPSRSHRHES